MPYQPKRFQREDLARAALHDGLINGWDTGLGKTIFLYLWPLLKLGLQDRAQSTERSRTHRLIPNGTILIIAPGDLHDQILKDGRDLFKTVPTLLDSQETFLRHSTFDIRHSRRVLAPGYYLTSYHQLTHNGTHPPPTLDLDSGTAGPSGTDLARLGHSPAHVAAFFDQRGALFADDYALLGATPQDTAPQLRARWFKLRKQKPGSRGALDAAYETLAPLALPPVKKDRALSSARSTSDYSRLTAESQSHVTRLFLRRLHPQCVAGIGQTRNGIKCVYSPTLADYTQDVFDAVVADEGTRIKGTDTILGTGVRQMQPRYFAITSATPIKNRLPDLFWLAWKVCGGHAEPTARFPYAGTPEARQDFIGEYMITERNLTKEAQSETKRRYVKVTPQVCNIHRLWKFIGPIILRRRKADCGEDIVAKHRHVIRVPLGTHQAATYRYHLKAKYVDCHGRPAVGAQLTALRQAACDPTSANLLPQKGPREVPSAQPFRSRYSYIPKLASALSLIRDCLVQREQIILFHTFHDSIDLMSARLQEAGVPHLVMDGRTPPARRGRMAGEFKRRKWPVMLANSECMAEGHSFAQCAYVAHYSFPWAMDKILQSDDRVHRINSPKDVHSFRLTALGSIDLKMEAQGSEKSDAAELVLDGSLLSNPVEELSAIELLQIAQQAFDPAAQTVDEEALLREWPALRASLQEAARNFTGLSAPSTYDLQPSTFVPDPTFADLPLWQLAA